jgi:dTDP-4-dehydrorhamnose reductase
MSLKVLVIGASGFLGGSILRSHDPRFEFIGPDRSVCDITNAVSIRETFDSVRPKIAVLCAALADIDRCENHPDVAHTINVEGAKTVASECARSGARLLFTSSGAVFDGTAETYHESDPTHPISVYGKTKAEAEEAIREIVPDAVIVRLALVLGFSPHGGTNALLDKLHAALKQGSAVRAPADEYRNAIDAGTLTQWMLDLATEASGIFHLGSSDAISRYQLVRNLAESMGYPSDLVLPADSSPYRAPRGRRHMLVPEKIRQHSRVPVPTSLQTIERCIHVTV